VAHKSDKFVNAGRVRPLPSEPRPEYRLQVKTLPPQKIRVQL
jgi:hypothetical protein